MEEVIIVSNLREICFLLFFKTVYCRRIKKRYKYKVTQTDELNKMRQFSEMLKIKN